MFHLPISDFYFILLCKIDNNGNKDSSNTNMLQPQGKDGEVPGQFVQGRVSIQPFTR